MSNTDIEYRKVLFSLINYSAASETTKTVAKILKSFENNSYKIIIRDHSPLSEVDLIKELLDHQLDKVDILRDASNPGFGTGHNKNYEHGSIYSPGVFVILNSDIIFDYTAIYAAIKLTKEKCLVSPAILTEQSEIWFAGGRISKIDGDLSIRRCIPKKPNKGNEFCTGCVLVMRWEDFDSIGRFDENFFMYGEDLDLSVRAKKLGFNLLISPLPIVHKVGSGFGGKYSDLYLYEGTKNKLKAIRKNNLGIPAIRELSFFLKYIVARTIQLTVHREISSKRFKLLLKAFIDALYAK